MELLNNLPVEYKRRILMGYSSIILISLAFFLNYTMKYRTINGNLGFSLATGVFMMAVMVFIYYSIKTPT